MSLRWLKIITLVSVALSSPLLASSSSDEFSVLGIIASTKSSSGVALLKTKSTGKTFAARVGFTIASNIVLKSVKQRTIEILKDNKTYILFVGDDSSNAQVAFESYVVPQGPKLDPKQFEKDGNTVSVSANLRDHIVNERLGEVLMQAAAVPFLQNGRLAGFTLWDIEPGSVFELAGLKSGDTVTSINGTPINDVGATIRLLNSMRKEPQASIEFLRDGKSQNLTLAFR